MPERPGDPLPCSSRVLDGLERRHRLRDHDEERLRRLETGERTREIGGIDVRDEARRELARGVGLERLVRHRGAEVAAADPDVDDGADSPTGRPHPLPVLHLLRERGHAVELRVHLLHHVHPVHHERSRAWHPQRDVQRRDDLPKCSPALRETSPAPFPEALAPLPAVAGAGACRPSVDAWSSRGGGRRLRRSGALLAWDPSRRGHGAAEPPPPRGAIAAGARLRTRREVQPRADSRTDSDSFVYAPARSSCQKTALPATRRSAPASLARPTVSALMPPSTCTRVVSGQEGPELRDARRRLRHERLARVARVDGHAQDEVGVPRPPLRPPRPTCRG